jgi:elongation factor Ts
VISCETDFVAKNSDFVSFAENIMTYAMENKISTREELLNGSINGRKVEELLIDMTGKTGEKVELPAYNVINAPCVSAYNHNGNRLATIAAFNLTGYDKVAYEIAMQIAAMNPISLNADSIPQDIIDHELEIARETTRQEGKPENMIEKIAQGKLNKFFKESTLLNQEFIMNNKISVGDYLKENNKELTCTGFFRLQLGA